MKSFIAFTLLAFVSGTGTIATGYVAPAAGGIGLDDRHESNCNGHTIGFWHSPNGEELIEAGDFLSYLPSLHVVDELGNPFTTDDFRVFEDWIQHANATNMAYMLSAQLVAMQFSVLAGNVDEQCVIRTNAGELTIGELIDKAIHLLINDGYTPAGDPHRRPQLELKNLLDAANNNQNWS